MSLPEIFDKFKHLTIEEAEIQFKEGLASIRAFITLSGESEYTKLAIEELNLLELYIKLKRKEK